MVCEQRLQREWGELRTRRVADCRDCMRVCTCDDDTHTTFVCLAVGCSICMLCH